MTSALTEPSGDGVRSQEAARRRLHRSRCLFVGSLLGLLVVFVPLLAKPLLGLSVFAETGLVLRFEPWSAEAATADTRGVTNAHDTMDSLLPREHEFGQRLRAGDIPMWDPYEAGGGPLASVPEQGLLSPLSLPYAVLPASYAPGLVRLLEILAAVGFCFLFLRRLALSPGPALLGGFLYSTSAFFVVWNSWPQAEVASLIPALFWAIERALHSRRAVGMIPLALVMAAMLLSSFPAVLGYSLYLAGPYLLVRTLPSRARGTVRQVLSSLARPWAAVAGGCVLGIGLAAFQLVPFVQHLTTLDLSYRHQGPRAHPPLDALVTLVAPYAYGTETTAGGYYGYKNFIETVTYVGAVCVLLALLGLILRGRTSLPRGVLGLFAAAVPVLVLVGWGSDRALGFAQHLPFLGTSYIGRVRAVLCFCLVVLAAIGAEKLLDARGLRRSVHPWGAALGGLVLVFAGGWVVRPALEHASVGGHRGTMFRAGLLPACLLLIAAAVVIVTRSSGRRSLLVGMLPLLIAVESLAFIAPRWPSENPRQLYPRTGVHQFLAAHLGADRFAASRGVMFPSTNTYFGLRSVSGHAFQAATWKDALKVASRGTPQGPTLTFVGADLASATSPVLDRLGARFYVAGLGAEVFGSRTDPPPSSAEVAVQPGTVVGVALRPQPRRALVLQVTSPVRLTNAAGPPGLVVARFRDARGRLLATVTRPGVGAGFVGRLVLALPETGGPATATHVDLTFQRMSARLAADSSGHLVHGAVLPAHDGLSLAYAGDAVVYRRLHAQPRVRFASSASYAPTNAAALQTIATGQVAARQVVLNDSVRPDRPPATSGTGQVTLRRDDGDEQKIDVTSDQGGWVVLADSMQNGWLATVDGKRADLVQADEAGVAVHVPPGKHHVDVSYRPPGLRKGSLVTLVTILVLGALLLRSRHATRGSGGYAPDGPAPDDPVGLDDARKEHGGDERQ